jgi:conserved oligomeric Golgi complex subunit 6
MMEATAQDQETAYERLYRWVLAEARTLGRAGPDLAPTHARALLALRDRTVLFK